MVTPDQIRLIRQCAQEAREAAQLAVDGVSKARLHDIANELERLAEDLEAASPKTSSTC